MTLSVQIILLSRPGVLRIVYGTDLGTAEVKACGLNLIPASIPHCSLILHP